jgi:twitching motility protein PilT
MPNSPLIEKYTQLIDEVVKNRITDLHLGSGDFPYIRMMNRNVEPVESFGKLSYEDIIEFIHFMNPDLVRESIEVIKTGLTFIYEKDGTRFRANVSKNNEWIAIALRTIKKDLPTAEWVWLKWNLLKLLQEDRGLILITGGTGSGKTTTLMAMVNYLNENFHKHIITVEDPIEYVIKNNKSLIHQKQVGRHVATFDQAIRDAMREDPDILVVWEMRDQETITAVLTLAETGHLVISTLHTNDVVQAFDRLIYAFPATMQSQIRIQLALVLLAVVWQIILPRKDETGNLVAREIFINNDSTRNIIMDGNISHLYGVMETGMQDGQVMMQQAMIELHKTDQISNRTLMEHIKDPVRLKEYLQSIPEKGRG